MDKLWIMLAMSALHQSEYGKRHIADEFYQALPVPIIVEGKQSLAVAFFLTTPMRPNKPWYLVEPLVVGVVSYPEKNVSWQKVSYIDFKLKTIEGPNNRPVLGAFDRSHIKNGDDWFEAKKQYEVAINKVIEKQWLLGKNPSPIEQKKVAKELKDLMEYLEDKPLKAFYKEFGHDLKSWIQKNS